MRTAITICQLLSRCGVVARNEVGSILTQAAVAGMTPGKFLVEEKKLDPRLVRAAVLCQLLLQRKLIDYQTVAEALELTKSRGIQIEEALKEINWNRAYFENMYQMSEMLIRSDVITAEESEMVYDICLRDRNTFLYALVKRGSINEVLAERTLSLHERMTKGQLTFDQAVAKLSNDSPSKRAGRVRPASSTISTGQFKLGELLLASNWISSEQLIAALERSRSENALFGAVLIRDHGLPESILEHALELQKQVNEGASKISQSTFSLLNQHAAARKFDEMLELCEKLQGTIESDTSPAADSIRSKCLCFAGDALFGKKKFELALARDNGSRSQEGKSNCRGSMAGCIRQANRKLLDAGTHCCKRANLPGPGNTDHHVLYRTSMDTCSRE